MSPVSTIMLVSAAQLASKSKIIQNNAMCYQLELPHMTWKNLGNNTVKSREVDRLERKGINISYSILEKLAAHGTERCTLLLGLAKPRGW